MAALATARKKPQSKPEQKPEPKPGQGSKQAQKRALGAVPAYLQRKLDVGSANDSAEAEADRVADRVLQRAASGGQGPKPREPEPTPKAAGVQRKEVNATDKLAAAERAEKSQLAAQAASAPAREDALQRKPQAGSTEAAQERKQELKDEKREQLQRRTAPAGGPLPIARRSMGPEGGEASSAIEQRLAERAGGGAPLPAPVREHMGREMGADFSSTRVHTDGEAASLASDLNAQAFTVGNDVYFNQGRYQPDTPAGSHLLAHELAHVVQQGGEQGSAQRLIRRGGTAPARGAGRRRGALSREEQDAARSQTLAEGQLTGNAIAFDGLPLPRFKSERVSGELRRDKNTTEDGRSGNQARRWRSDLGSETKPALLSRVQEILQVGDDASVIKAIKTYSRTPGGATVIGTGRSLGENSFLIGTASELSNSLIIPLWDGASPGTPAAMEVDHVKDHQLGGQDGLDNFVLLEREVNRASGDFVKRSIRAKVRAFLVALGRSEPTPAEVDRVLATYDLTFAQPEAGDACGWSRSKMWEPGQIRNAEHLAAGVVGTIGRRRSAVGKLVVLDPNDIGEPGRLCLFRERAGGRRKTFALNGNQPVIASGDRDYVGGFRLDSISFNPGATNLGSLVFTPGPRFKAPRSPKTVDIQPIPGFSGGGWIDVEGLRAACRGMQVEGASPLSIDEFAEVGDALSPRCTVTTDVPFLRGMTFALELGPRDTLIVSAEIPGSAINLPQPFRVEACLLRLSASSSGSLSVTGLLALAIDNVGRGELQATARTGAPSAFEFDGWFEFDSDTFTQARVEVGYHAGEWSFDGTLAIGEGKLRGVRSATLHVHKDADTISADGRGELTIPGVSGVDLAASHSNAEGFVVTAGVDLASNAMIRSGRLAITLRKRDGAWKLGATGTAVPNVPGIDASVSVSYDDGTFSAETSLAYSRERLSGSLTLGVTNAPLGEDGRPTGPAEEGAELVVYGGGSLTIRITPWLEGTAGVRVLPNGEIEVHGRVAVPQPVTVFDARRWDRTLISVGLDIPIFGVAVAGQRIGIFCTIGGDLKLVAGIGPAQLQNIALDVTYNPSHEDQAHVVGTAAFHMPADAGLELGVHAAIGAGIPIVSAQAGINLTGKLGIATALDVPLTVDWTPATGFSIDAPISLTLSPSFTFAVNGYVLVEADLWITTIELYREDWNLASLTVGSGYELGLEMPFHYAEGEPFNPSLDDIRLRYPEVDPMQLLESVFERIT